MNLLKATMALSGLLAGLLFVFSAQAADVTLLTGLRTGAYYEFGTEIANVAEKAGMDIIVRESPGSIANIKTLMKPSKELILGFVQADILNFLKRSTDPRLRRVAQRVRLVFPLYNEEAHLFASTNVKDFDDLRGKRFIVGERDSGNWLTAVNLLQMTGVKPAALLYMSPLKAATAVLQGNADAMIYVAGEPAPLFTQLGELRNKPEYAPLFNKVHFAPLEDTVMLREYNAASISPAAYPWIAAKVPTISVKSLLISLPPAGDKPTQAHCEALNRLAQAVRSNYAVLRQQGHVKWQEVNLDASVGQWKLDPCLKLPTDVLKKSRPAR